MSPCRSNVLLPHQVFQFVEECLLILKNCEMQAESLKQRIQRLNDEMAKGTKVYSREELTKLKSMLDDALQTLQLLEDESKPTLGM